MDCFKAIFFIQQANENRRVELLEIFLKGTYKGRYEYTKTVSGAYRLLTCKSGKIGTYKCQSGLFNHCGRGGGISNFMFLHE